MKGMHTDVNLLCNSLNAIAGTLPDGERAVLTEAQNLILTLLDSNHKLQEDMKFDIKKKAIELKRLEEIGK